MPNWVLEQQIEDRWKENVTVMFAVCGRYHSKKEHIDSQDAIARRQGWVEGQPPFIWYLGGTPSTEFQNRWAGITDPKEKKGSQDAGHTEIWSIRKWRL